MSEKLFFYLLIGGIFFSLIKGITTFLNKVRRGKPDKRVIHDELAEAFNLERCTPTTATNRAIRALTGIPDSLRGHIAGYHLMIDFHHIADGEERTPLPHITFFVPQNRTYHFNLTRRGLLSEESDYEVKTCCPDFDRCYTLSGFKGYHTAAYLNEDVRKLLLEYFRKGKLKFAEGKLLFTPESKSMDDWVKVVNDLLALTTHFTANLNLQQALTHILLTDSSEGVRVNAMVQLKKLGLLSNLKEHLATLAEHPNDEIAVLAACELGSEQIPRLINILQKETGKEPPYRVDPPYIAADYLKGYLDDRRVSETFYQLFEDQKLASRIKDDDKYGFILELLVEREDSRSIPYIVAGLPRLSGRLQRNSPFKKTLLNYLDVLEVKESNDWLLKELDYSSDEEKLRIIKLLGKFNQSTSLEKLERYSKSPLASKEIREAALQAMGEIY